MITCVHISDTDNLGDNVSCPADYVEWLAGAVRVPISKYTDSHPGPVIFGGGGLLHGKLLELMASLADSHHKRIIWGAGMNEHHLRATIQPKFLDDFDLVGLRDYGNPWNYVPCPSCMHPAFNGLVSGTRAGVRQIAYGILEHYDHPIPIQGVKIQNRGSKEEFPRVLEWISRCEVLVTNSYHGAYWALLIGIAVLLYKPFSSRFYSLPWALPEVDEADWLGKVMFWQRQDPPRLDLALCRELNRKFSEKAKAIYEGQAVRDLPTGELSVDIGVDNQVETKGKNDSLPDPQRPVGGA